MNPVLNEVLTDLAPSDDDNREDMLSALRSALNQATVQLGGSVSKNTHVGDDYDIDIFIKFPLSANSLSDRLETALNELSWTYERVQASRDYFIVSDGKHDYELVPVLNIDQPSQAKSVIDVSPLHIDYFNNRAHDTTRDHVRLLKQFVKAHRIYGAESYINGFSGHVIDLLILAYGSFSDVLEAAQDWSPKTVIDIEEHHDTPMLTLNESKTHGPLIVVDPIQSERNAAAAVNDAAYHEFIDAAKAFLNEPRGEAFTKPTLAERISSLGRAEGDQHEIIQVTVSFDERRHDLAGARLRKIQEHIERRLDGENFHVAQTLLHHEETSAVLIATTPTPKTDHRVINGPPVDMDEHVKRFTDQHDKTEERNERVLAHEPNTYATVEEALEAILGEDYVQSRCETTSTHRPSS